MLSKLDSEKEIILNIFSRKRNHNYLRTYDVLLLSLIPRMFVKIRKTTCLKCRKLSLKSKLKFAVLGKIELLTELKIIFAKVEWLSKASFLKLVKNNEEN